MLRNWGYKTSLKIADKLCHDLLLTSSIQFIFHLFFISIPCNNSVHLKRR